MDLTLHAGDGLLCRVDCSSRNGRLPTEHLVEPTNSSLSSSSNSLPLEPSIVSDSSASQASATSASGDRLNKRRKYRRKRSFKRRHSSADCCAAQPEAASAVYCEEWLFGSKSAESVDETSFKHESADRFETGALEIEPRAECAPNNSWLDEWRKLLAMKPNSKSRQLSRLASITERDASPETISTSSDSSPASPSSVTNVASASGRVAACKSYHSTNGKVCAVLQIHDQPSVFLK